KQAEVLVDVSGEKERPGAIRRVVVTATLAGGEAEKDGGDTQLPPVQVERIKVVPGEDQGSTSGDAPAAQPSLEEEEIAGNLPPKITAAEVQQVQSRIVNMITHFYGLEPGQVDVRILEVRSGR
ncbi:MAG: stage III sporulation protein AF, partial [Moorella sp. (in: Bacteria)]|nr:stage III sporulation protein AF [Moorella sp. (in: firmicutes)]